MPLLPPHLKFTESPGHADDKTLRAAGQSSRYSTAKSKAQQTKATVREDVRQVEDVSTLEASDSVDVQITPQEQDLNAAGILVEVAREQHPISPALDTGSLSVTKTGASDANASPLYTRKCPITSCAYHLDRNFWSRTEKNNHIMTHFEGQVGFVTNGSRYSLPWPNYIEDPENFFPKVEILKQQLRDYLRLREYLIWGGFEGVPEDSMCYICSRNFDWSGYVKHLDDCIVHAVQEQASGTAQACPVSTCEHDPPKLPCGSGADEPMVKRFVPSLGCGRCYTNQCQCRPMQQERAKSSAEGFTRLCDEILRRYELSE